MSPLHVWIIVTFYKGKGPYVVVFQVCEHGNGTNFCANQCLHIITFVLNMVCWNMMQDNLVGEI